MFNQNKNIIITQKRESSIGFRKGSFWDLQFTPKKINLEGKIIFEGNGESTVKIIYDRTFSIFFHLTIMISLIFLFVMTYAMNPLISVIFLIAIIIATIYRFFLINKGEKLFSNDFFIHLSNLTKNWELTVPSF